MLSSRSWRPRCSRLDVRSAVHAPILSVRRALGRVLDGIELPFSLTREVHGRPIDLWHVIRYDVNPPDLDAVFKR